MPLAAQMLLAFVWMDLQGAPLEGDLDLLSGGMRSDVEHTVVGSHGEPPRHSALKIMHIMNSHQKIIQPFPLKLYH